MASTTTTTTIREIIMNIDETSTLIDMTTSQQQSDVSEKPVLTERLADYKIDADLLKSKQFRMEISRFAMATNVQIASFLEEFGVIEQHIVDRYYLLEDDKMEAILKYLIEDRCVNITVKDFIERLWDIEFKVIAFKIKENENKILEEFDDIKKKNMEQESNEKLLIESIDNKMDVKLNLELNLKTKQYTLQQKPLFGPSSHDHFDTPLLYYTNSEMPRARDMYDHTFLLQSSALISLNRSNLEQYNNRFKQNRNVLLLSVSKDVNNSENYLKTKETFKQKLTDNNIRFTDIATDIDNIDNLFSRENGRFDPIFVLFDDKLNVLFDEKLNKNDNCKYKTIGRRMYGEYIMNKCKNERFYTFLIENNVECKEVKYKWLTNIYINNKKQSSIHKISIDENDRLNDDIDEFLINFD